MKRRGFDRPFISVVAVFLLLTGCPVYAGFMEVTEEALGAAPPDVAGWVYGSWADYNNDGWPDLHNGGDILFENNGDGTFTQVSGIGLEVEWNVAYRSTWADADNDGDLDCIQSNDTETDSVRVTKAYYFLNSGDPGYTFTRYTVFENPLNMRTETPVFVDGDGDGFCEVYQATFGNWDPNYERGPDRYFMAAGGVVWTDATATHIPELETGSGERHSRGVVACDYDNDGDMDIFVPVYGVAGGDPSWENFLWQNNGTGHFTDVAAEAGVHIEPNGRYGVGLSSGASWGDYDNDGDFDLAVANIHGRLAVYRNNGDGSFINMGDENGLPTGRREWHNCLWVDFDNDGDLDIFGSQWYENRPAVLYENEGPESIGHFHEVTPDQGFTQNTHFNQVDGFAAADYDRDGDLDVYFYGGRDEFRGKHLFRNDLDTETEDNHWLVIELIGDGAACNRSALGAQIRLRYSNGWSGVRQVESTSSDGTENMLPVHFGLGTHAGLEEVVVRWPYGTTEIWTWTEIGGAVDRWITLEQGTGTVGAEGLLIVTGPGPHPANPPLMRVLHAGSPALVFGERQAYGVPKQGVNVACGDLDGNGWEEVITGPGPGTVFGPHVRGFDTSGSPISEINFLAYGTNKYGVNVAAGDIDGDGADEIITGAGPGKVFGPHVRGWKVQNAAVSSIGGVSFLAYGTNRYGVNVTAGDIDGDGYDEIVTGAGPGAVFGAHVRAWDYDGSGGTAAIPRVSYLAYGTPRWGVNVACGDLDGDGMDEIITGAGPGSVFGSHLRAWNYDGNTVSAMPGVSLFAYPGSSYGVYVGAGDVDGDGVDEILTMPGPDMSQPAHLKAWNVDGGPASLIGTLDFDVYDDLGLIHGGKIAGGSIYQRQ